MLMWHYVIRHSRGPTRVSDTPENACPPNQVPCRAAMEVCTSRSIKKGKWCKQVDHDLKLSDCTGVIKAEMPL